MIDVQNIDKQTEVDGLFIMEVKACDQHSAGVVICRGVDNNRFHVPSSDSVFLQNGKLFEEEGVFVPSRVS